MTIPQVFGKSKIRMLRGQELHEVGKKGQHEDMSFSYGDEGVPQEPSFNVLYIETPKIGVLQTPAFQLLAQTWEETVELVKPLMRFGFPETSLRTKCPYYNEDLHATSSGPMLANDRLRKLMTGIQRGALQPQQQQHHQQQQHAQLLIQDSSSVQMQEASTSSSSSGPLGFGNFLGATGHDSQPRYRHHSLVPRSQLLVPDIPSGTLVLALNLMAYWAITKQSRRGFGG